MDNVDLSVVIICSSRNYIFDCLKSLLPALKKVRSEIFVVDNASKENVGSEIKNEFPNIRLIRREKNGGFGENNNMALKIAVGKFVLLLNDDTKIIDINIFEEMLEWLNKHPKAGLATCALVNPDNITLQGSGGYFPTLGRVFAWMTFIDDLPFIDNLIKPYHPMHSASPLYTNTKYFTLPHRQDWVTGAFFLARKEALNQAGLFDEDFFLYVEEVELSYRIAQKGWETWYLPKWKTVHYGMSTNGNENATIFEMQNIKLMYKKHFPKWQLNVLEAVLKLGIILRVALFGLISPSMAKIYVKAFKTI